MKFKKILFNNLGIKVLALILAFITWLYIGEVTKKSSGKTILQKLLTPRTLSVKTMTVKPILVGRVPEGYEIAREDIKVEPETIIVAAPRGILMDKEFIYTKPIDLGEYTRPKVLDAELKDISRAARLEKVTVRVILPIKKASGAGERSR